MQLLTLVLIPVKGGGVAGKGKPQSITIPNVNGENEEFIDLRD